MDKPFDVTNQINRFGQYFQAVRFVFQRLTKYIKLISRLTVHESVVLLFMQSFLQSRMGHGIYLFILTFVFS